MNKQDTLEKLKMLNSLMEDFLDMMELDDADDEVDKKEDFLDMIGLDDEVKRNQLNK